MTVITDTISVKDFIDIHEAVSETHVGVANLHSLLTTIAQNAIDSHLFALSK